MHKYGKISIALLGFSFLLIFFLTANKTSKAQLAPSTRLSTDVVVGSGMVLDYVLSPLGPNVLLLNSSDIQAIRDIGQTVDRRFVDIGIEDLPFSAYYSRTFGNITLVIDPEAIYFLQEQFEEIFSRLELKIELDIDQFLELYIDETFRNLQDPPTPITLYILPSAYTLSILRIVSPVLGMLMESVSFAMYGGDSAFIDAAGIAWDRTLVPHEFLHARLTSPDVFPLFVDLIETYADFIDQNYEVLGKTVGYPIDTLAILPKIAKTTEIMTQILANEAAGVSMRVDTENSALGAFLDPDAFVYLFNTVINFGRSNHILGPRLNLLISEVAVQRPQPPPASDFDEIYNVRLTDTNSFNYLDDIGFGGYNAFSNIFALDAFENISTAINSDINNVINELNSNFINLELFPLTTYTVTIPGF